MFSDYVNCYSSYTQRITPEHEVGRGQPLYITFGLLVQHGVNLSRADTWLDISVTKRQTETE